MLSKFLTNTNPKVTAETPLANEIREYETFGTFGNSTSVPDLLFKPEINKKSEKMNNKNSRIPIHERQYEIIRKKEEWRQ
jgi:hypothetical protein